MDFEHKNLLNELTQGREVTTMLMKHLHHSSSHETRQVLLDKILCSYEKALSILNCNATVAETKPTVSSIESPPSSDVFDKKDVFKKRRISSGWTDQIRVPSRASLDNPLEDGYCWRKYGQKAILGSSYPRGYYRCTHRHSQGCLAIKQVQRSDDDHTVFEVKYRGRHTCNQVSHFAATFVPTESKDNKGNQSQKRKHQFESGLKVKTEDLDKREGIFPSFSFTIESEEVKNGSFVEALMENDIMGDFGISSLDKLEFDPTFPFDDIEFFS